MLLDGLHLPLTTPFHADGRLNLLKLKHNVERYSKSPAAGMVALGAWGEATLLSDEEKRQVLREVAEAALPQKVLVAGILEDSVMGALTLADFAAKCGFDAVLVRRPSLLRGDREGRELTTYFQALADRSPLPVVLFSGDEDPDALTVEVVAELSKHSSVLGVVEASREAGRMERIKAATAAYRRDVRVTSVFAAVTRRMAGDSEDGELISAAALRGGKAMAPPKLAAKTRMKTVGFQILAGRTDGMLEGLCAGAVGAVAGFAAAAPQACYEVVAAWKDGDEGLSKEKQIRLREVAEWVEARLGVAGIKYGCDLNGYFGGRPRLPLLPLSGEERTQVERMMQGMRH